MDKRLKDRFGGIDRLYGSGALERFAGCHVTVVGIGGVGSWAVEALARSGIGKLTLIDADDLCVSNTNRQLPALEGQYGRAKVEAMGERCRAINPGIDLDLKPQFLTPTNMGELLEAPGDVVLDACDSFRSKVEAIAYCRRRKQPIVTVPKNHDRYFGVRAVYSLENVRYPQADGSVCGVRPQLGKDEGLKLDCGAGLGAATHVTGAFAFAAVGKVLEMLLKQR